MNAPPEHLAYRLDTVRRALSRQIVGRVSSLTGLTVEVDDFPAPVGAQCLIRNRHEQLPAEVIGFRHGRAVVMPLGDMVGISQGDRVFCLSTHASVPIGPELLGRVIDGRCNPIDNKGPLLCQTRRPVIADRTPPLHRRRIDAPLGTGIRAIDGLLTAGCGQRLGIFSGPGVGKSILLGMIGRYTAADVIVIALVGERGREVREFIEKDLGPQGLSRAVMVVSTSDEPAPVRVQAGFVAATIAEYFRDRDLNVLLLMDSVTRVAMAQRQIGLALGEPPATKGYTPSVFALLPRLIERCGCGAVGSITGFFSVLVEGDDLAEPISDAMRGLLDGHIWLSRTLANRAHYPAIDILESVSRVMVDIVDDDQIRAARAVKRLVAVYRDIEDLVNIGAYAPGTNPEYDLAVSARDRIDQFLTQSIRDHIPFPDAVNALKKLAAELQPAAGPKQNNPDRQNTTAPNSSPSQPDTDNTSSASAQRVMAGLS